MHHTYDYLILGGGMTADAAANGIRKQRGTGSIAIIGNESHPPFPRPALSKKLWTDESFTVENTALKTTDRTGAGVVLEDAAVDVDTTAKRVTTASGDIYEYDKLLIATGGHPTTIDGLPAGERVFYYRTLADYYAVAALVADRPHVVVVGGGYIGSEMAAALVQQGCRVTLVHPGEVVSGHMFPREISERFESAFVQAGVEIMPGLSVEGGSSDATGVTLQLSDGSELRGDLAVIGLGVSPSTDFLSGVVDLDDDGGIVVDERLATSAADVWAAGDVASYPDKILGRRRVEHVDNATTMGGTAGRIIAGSDEVYDHTPMFYSDVFDLSYEAVGTLDSSLDTFVEEVDGEAGSAIVYYADEDAVRGVLLWNGAPGLDAAKDLLADGSRPQDLSELAGSLDG